EPERRDGHRPGRHAPWAQCGERENALVDEPAHESERACHADVEGDPEPSRESQPAQHHDADRDDREPTPYAEKRVRKSEERPLPRPEILAALDEHADVAGGRGRGVDEGAHLLNGETQCREESRSARDREKETETEVG